MPIPDLKDIIELCTDGDELIIVDGGSRNFNYDLTVMGIKDLVKYSAIYGFEPSPQSHDSVPNIEDEVDKNRPPSRNQVINYPFALANVDGEVILHLSLHPGASSTLPPNAELLGHFRKDKWSGMVEIVDSISVPSIRLDTFVQKAALPRIDFLKLDTQGNELDILQSAGDFIKKIGVIKTELNFLELYLNQPLAHDVMKFLHSLGFALIDLTWSEPCRRFQARPDLKSDSYRLVWGDGIFAQTPHDFKKPHLLKQALILGKLGYRDLAIYQVQNHPGLKPEAKKMLEDYFFALEYQEDITPIRQSLRRLRYWFWMKTGFWVERKPRRYVAEKAAK